LNSFIFLKAPSSAVRLETGTEVTFVGTRAMEPSRTRRDTADSVDLRPS
jgi:hypothetical protein